MLTEVSRQMKQSKAQLKVEARERQAWAPCNQYYKLVCQEAWKAWKKLPHSVKVWITPDDMISHGMAVTYQYITKHYDSKRSNSITTGLVHVLHNMFIHEYLEQYGAWKRGWQKKDGKLQSIEMVSLEAYQEDTSGIKFLQYLESLVQTEDTIIENAVTKCFVIPAMSKIYTDATPELKNEMVEWFWFKSPKVHTKGKPFQKMANEFRELAHNQNLSYFDCLHLVRSPECLDNLSRELFQIPYDNHCIPIVN